MSDHDTRALASLIVVWCIVGMGIAGLSALTDHLPGVIFGLGMAYLPGHVMRGG